jgi:hypothetical protein
MTNQSRKHFFRSLSVIVLLLGMVIFGAAQQASAASFALQADSNHYLTFDGTSLTGNLSITGEGLASGDHLEFNANAYDPAVTGFITTYTLLGSFTLYDPRGTLTGTFTTARLERTSIDSTVFSLLGLATSNAYYNGTIARIDSDWGTVFGLPVGINMFNGGTLTFSQTSVKGYPTFGGGSLTSGTAPSTVPVPPSLLLLGTGLAGFIVLRRKISKK